MESTGLPLYYFMPDCNFSFLDKLPSINWCDFLMQRSHSLFESAVAFSILIQKATDNRGIGTMPSLSISSAKFSSVHFKPVLNAPSMRVPQNIFFPIEKHRSVPYFISSVAYGRERHSCLSTSMVIAN